MFSFVIVYEAKNGVKLVKSMHLMYWLSLESSLKKSETYLKTLIERMSLKSAHDKARVTAFYTNSALVI